MTSTRVELNSISKDPTNFHSKQYNWQEKLQDYWVEMSLNHVETITYLKKNPSKNFICGFQNFHFEEPTIFNVQTVLSKKMITLLTHHSISRYPPSFSPFFWHWKLLPSVFPFKKQELLWIPPAPLVFQNFRQRGRYPPLILIFLSETKKTTFAYQGLCCVCFFFFKRVYTTFGECE